VVLQAHRVDEGVHGERVLRRSFGAEEVDLGAEAENEEVVLKRRELRELHLAGVEVDRRHGRLVDRGVLLVLDEVAERVADGGLLEQAGRELIKERLEGVVVVLSTSTTSRLGVLQLLGRADPAKPPPRMSTRGRPLDGCVQLWPRRHDRCAGAVAGHPKWMIQSNERS
jgi:hypothetical protein